MRGAPRRSTWPASVLATGLLAVVFAAIPAGYAVAGGNGNGASGKGASSSSPGAHGTASSDNASSSAKGASSSQGSSSDSGSQHGSGGQAPAGNNGHIQIDEFAADGGNGNDAHVSCALSVSFFGYDSGTQQASITLTPWSPTRGGHSIGLTTSWTTATRTAGNQLDQNVQVSPADVASAFSGVAPAHEGYHARIDVEVTGSQGSDDKSHMVWIQPCATSGATRATASGTTLSPAGPTGATGVSTTATSSQLTIVKSERVGTTGSFQRGPVRVLVGEQLQYQIVVADTGDTALTVTLSDPRCDAGTLAPTDLQTIAPAASLTYTCSHVVLAVPASRTFRNVATATGTTATGTTVGPVRSSVLARVTHATLRVATLARTKPARPVLKQAGFTG